MKKFLTLFIILGITSCTNENTDSETVSIDKDKKLIISILKPMHPGMSKDEFLKNLENCIYSELDLLC